MTQIGFYLTGADDPFDWQDPDYPDDEDQDYWGEDD